MIEEFDLLFEFAQEIHKPLNLVLKTPLLG